MKYLFCILFLFSGLFPAYSGTLEDIRKKVNKEERDDTGSTGINLKAKIGITETKRGVIYVPPGYDPAKPVSALFLCKWYDGWPMQIVEIWMAHADKHNLILIAPASTGRAYSKSDKSRAMRFFKAALETYNIDRKNILIFGHSNGAHLAINLGLKYHKYFKAIVFTAGSIRRSQAHFGGVSLTRNAERQPRIYNIIGLSDQKVRINNARYTRDKFESYGYSVLYKELPGVGHVIPDSELDPILDWFNSFEYRE